MPPSSHSLADDVLERLFDLKARRERPCTEQSLADYFEISRTPVRDALMSLESAGLVERRQRKGVYLREPSLPELSELYEMRVPLEGLLLRQAAERMDKHERKTLRDLSRRHAHAEDAGHSRRQSLAVLRFRKVLFELAGNEQLQRFLQRTDRTRQIFDLYQRSKCNELRDYPVTRLYKLLRKSEPEQAATTAEAYWASVRDRFVKQAMRAPRG